MKKLTKHQQATLNELLALHKVIHTALANPHTPTGVNHYLAGVVQSTLRGLSKTDLKAVTDAFCKMDLRKL